MAQAIIHCDFCGRMIGQGEISHGRAIVTESSSVCAECAGRLAPDERKRLRRGFPRAAASVGPSSARGLPGGQGETPNVAPNVTPSGGRAPPRGHGAAGRPTAGPGAAAAGPRAPSRRSSVRAAGTRASRRSGIEGRAGAEEEPRSHKGVLFTCLTVGAIVGAALAWYVASGRSEKPGAEETREAAARAARDEPAESSQGAPTPKATGIPAQRRFAEIKHVFDPSFRNYEEGQRILWEFLAKYPEAPEAEEAKALLAKMSVGEVKAAEEKFAETARRAEDLASRGKLHQAEKALREFRDRVAESEWFKTGGEKKIAAAFAKVEAARIAAAKAAVERAREALGSKRLDEARGALVRRGRWPREARDAAEALLREIAAAEAEAEKLRAREEKWNGFVTALHAAGKRGVREASELAARERSALRELGFGGKLTRIERLMRNAKLVEELVAVGFVASRKTIRLRLKDRRVAGKVLGVKDGVIRLKPLHGAAIEIPLGGLSVEDMLRFSGVSRSEEGDPIKAASYLAIRGELEAARKKIAGVTSKKAIALAQDIDVIAKGVKPPEVVAATPAAGPAQVETERPPDVDPSLVGWWKLDDREGATARDSSAKGNDRTLGGSPMWRPSGGKVGGALRFDQSDGTHDFLDLGTATGSAESLTVAFWMRADALAMQVPVDKTPDDTSGKGWTIKLRDSGDLWLRIGSGTYKAKSHVDLMARSVYAAGEWVHVACTFDRGTAEIYVDGWIKGRRAGIARTVGNTTAALRLGFPGAVCGYERFNGLLDDVRIYDKALSGQEIKALFGLGGATARTASARRPSEREPTAKEAVTSAPGTSRGPLPGETGLPGEWAPGLVCEIFKGADLTNRIGVRVDRSIDYDFANSSPDLTGKTRPFSMRWRGHFLVPVEGEYNFVPQGGMQVKVDGRKAGGMGGVPLTKGLHAFEAVTAVKQGNNWKWSHGGRLNWSLSGHVNHPDPGSAFFHKVPEAGSVGPPAKLVRGLKAEYFMDDSCRRLVATGTMDDVNADLGDLPACTRCGKDRFSIRITGYLLAPRKAEYTFKVGTNNDDGVELQIGDTKVLDRWAKGVKQDTGKIKLDAGYHKLKIRFRDFIGGAKLRFRWKPGKGRETPVPEYCLFRELKDAPEPRVKRSRLAPGVKGYMYRGTKPAGRPVAERIDSSLTFDWSDKQPVAKLGKDYYSAVWRGLLMVPEAGQYIFRLEHDGGGVQLSVAGRTVVNRLGSGKGNEVSSPVKLPAGPAAISLVYNHKKEKKSLFKLFWTGPNFIKRPVGGADLAHAGSFDSLLQKPAPLKVKPPPKPPAGEPVKPGPEEPVEPLPKGNLVRNGGFEKTGSAAEVAEGWTKHQWGTGKGSFSVRLDRVNSHTGERSLVVRALGADCHPGARTTLTSSLPPARYEVRFWACAAIGKSADVCAHLAGRDVLSASVGEEWKQFKTTVEITEKKLKPSLRLYTTTQGVRVWFDDVEVEALPPAK